MMVDAQRNVLMENPTTKKALELAVITEQNGQRYYKMLANKYSDDAELTRIFERLAADEKVHEGQIQAILDGMPEGYAPGEQHFRHSGYLRALAISNFFKRGAFRDLDNIKTKEDALVNALEFEKQTKTYYDAIAEESGHTPELDELIATEKQHVETIMKVLLTDARFRGTVDQWP